MERKLPVSVNDCSKASDMTGAGVADAGVEGVDEVAGTRGGVTQSGGKD